MNIEYLTKSSGIYLAKVKDNSFTYYLLDTKENINNECALYFKDIQKVSSYISNYIDELTLIQNRISAANEKYYSFINDMYEVKGNYLERIKSIDDKNMEYYRKEIETYRSLLEYIILSNNQGLATNGSN